MTTVKRKSRLHSQFRLDPFVLFVTSSVAIHGLALWGFFFKRSQITEQEEPTRIDVVIVPPEESTVEPPLDTERQANKNSVAKGDVKPELPTASDRTNSEKAVATPASPMQKESPPIVPPTPPQKSTPPVTAPTPPQKSTPPVTAPAVPQSETAQTPPNEIKPEPLVKEPKPVPPQHPEPVANTPLVSESKKPVSLPVRPATEENPFRSDLPSRSEVTKFLPQPQTPSTETENPFKTDLPSKPEVTESLPQPQTPPTETEPDLPPVATNSQPLPKPIEPTPKATETLPQPQTPPTETEPDLPPVATNSQPLPKPIEPTPTETSPQNASVPETPTSESATAVGSGAASLLGGTQSRNSSEDSDSTFFAPEANASVQAANSSGVDARQNLDLGPYLAEVKQRVRQNWHSPNVDDSRQTVITFSIQRNGQIRGLQITQSSGSPQLDNEFIAAIQKSAPFAPLPANYPNSQLNIVYNLNINVYLE